jgi:hypothetical protein
MLRRPRFWIVSALVLVVLLVVADRGAKIVVENVVADRIQTAVSSPGKPSVSLGGFPFLTQLVGQKFDRVEVDIRDGDAGKVRVARVHAVLTGVERAGSGARAETIAGDGLISYSEASRAAAPFSVSYGGNGLVKITGKANVGGQSHTASATGRPRISGNSLIFSAEQVSTDLPGGAAPVTGLVPDIKIALRQIPAGLSIKLNPSEEGIGFSFTGRNVELASKDITAALGVVLLSPVSPDETAYARPAGRYVA